MITGTAAGGRLDTGPEALIGGVSGAANMYGGKGDCGNRAHGECSWEIESRMGDHGFMINNDLFDSARAS